MRHYEVKARRDDNQSVAFSNAIVSLQALFWNVKHCARLKFSIQEKEYIGLLFPTIMQRLQKTLIREPTITEQLGNIIVSVRRSYY